MNWNDFWDSVGLLAIALGALMSLTTSIGLLRLPDLFGRQHAASKPQILGLLLTLIGVGLRLRAVPEWSMLLLVAFFQLLTVPVSAHLITRAAYRGFTSQGEGTSLTDDAPDASLTGSLSPPPPESQPPSPTEDR